MIRRFWLGHDLAAGRSRQWAFESLEERAMFIVGANASLPPAPLDQFTGVVHLAEMWLTFPRRRDAAAL